MKKLNCYYFLIFVSMHFFVNCEKSFEPLPPFADSIFGTWDYVYEVYPYSAYMLTLEDLPYNSLSITFTSDSVMLYYLDDQLRLQSEYHVEIITTIGIRIRGNLTTDNWISGPFLLDREYLVISKISVDGPNIYFRRRN